MEDNFTRRILSSSQQTHKKVPAPSHIVASMSDYTVHTHACTWKLACLSNCVRLFKSIGVIHDNYIAPKLEEVCVCVSCTIGRSAYVYNKARVYVRTYVHMSQYSENIGKQ